MSEVLRKAILRRVHKARLDVEATGEITPVLLRLGPGEEPIVIADVLSVDDRLSEVWYEVSTSLGDRLTLRLTRETLALQVHTVETSDPQRWRGWSEE